MDTYDRQYVSAVINYFWEEGTTTPEAVNEKAAVIAFEALDQANVCSDAMDLVPRPTYGAVDIKYVLKQLAKIGKRVIQGDTAIYNVCKVTVALHYKTKIKMALLGI
jgi:hypothetical protein